MVALGQCCSTRPRIHFGAITADVGELCAALWAELLEEARHHLLAAASGGPDQPTTHVIDGQRHVASATTPADLVDADALQPVQPIVRARGLLHHAGDDPAHCLPVQPHQLATRFLRALRRQPGDLILERTQEAAAVARPGHSGDHHAVLATPDAGCRCLHDKAGGAQIQTAPPATALALIVEGTPLTADATPLSLAAFGAHVSYDTPVGFLDQALQHAVYHTQNPEPYTPTRHVVPLSRIDIEHRQRSGRRRASPWSAI